MHYDNYLLNAALYRHTQTEMVNIVETLVKMKKKKANYIKYCTLKILLDII